MPRSPIEALPATAAEALTALRNGTAQVALLRLPIDDEGLSAIPLYQETAVVVAPKDHPIAAFESLVLADLEGEKVLEGEDGDTVELVAANIGVAMMPQSLARVHSRRDVVARPVTDAAETTIALVWIADNTTAEVEEFVGIVRGRTANSSRGAGGSAATDSSAAATSRQTRPAGKEARPARKAARPAAKGKGKGKGRR